jgi:hypothetical protein
MEIEKEPRATAVSMREATRATTPVHFAVVGLIFLTWDNTFFLSVRLVVLVMNFDLSHGMLIEFYISIMRQWRRVS